MAMLFVILDGAADRGNDSLGGLTPLQKADMPNLKKIAERAAKGMVYPIAEGIAPESDAAVFSILGYDVSTYTGRGPLEALGAGLRVSPGSIAFRCNFGTVDGDRNVVDRRAGRIESCDAKALEKEVNAIDIGIPGVRFRFKSTVGHRGVCVFHSRKIRFSANVTNADIGYVKRGSISVAEESAGRRLPDVAPLDDTKEAADTAWVVNAFIAKAIEKLSASEINSRRRANGMLVANAILLRDGGIGLPKVVPLGQRLGMRCAFIAEMPVETGIAKLLGMDPIRLGVLRSRARRYRKMARLAIEGIASHGFVYVHIKGPDEPGHDGDAVLKTKILEEIDRYFFSAVRDLDADICVTCDHATPCPMKAHSADPVPLMVRHAGRDGGDPLPFDETIGTRGHLGIMNGNAVLDSILERR